VDPYFLFYAGTKEALKRVEAVGIAADQGKVRDLQVYPNPMIPAIVNPASERGSFTAPDLKFDYDMLNRVKREENQKVCHVIPRICSIP